MHVDAKPAEKDGLRKLTLFGLCSTLQADASFATVGDLKMLTHTLVSARASAPARLPAALPPTRTLDPFALLAESRLSGCLGYVSELLRPWSGAIIPPDRLCCLERCTC